MLGKLYRTPLRKTAALYAYAVAVLCKKGLNATLTDEIAVEYLADDLADIFKVVPTVDK